MVLLDPETDDVVIRVVYDGPPEAGKTTSVRALAGSLGCSMFTPEQKDGRTVFFDWLDYTGGLFEGHRIRCQVVSVPGQAVLAPRRRALLAEADVVVFVADTTRPHVDGLGAYLSGLARTFASEPGPPVGIVVQANKRDVPGAASIPEIRRLLDGIGLRVGIVESIATDGVGIREAFVFAVRLALDRAREQLRTGGLKSARPDFQSGEELLAEMRRGESGRLDLASVDGLHHTRLHEVTVADDAVAQAVREDQEVPAQAGVWHPPPSSHEVPPRLPGAGVGGGLIWPPVNGRLVLHEATEAPVDLARNEGGDWLGTGEDRWQIQSPTNSTFADIDRGRRSLVEWARVHSGSASVLSGDRCIVLAEDHHGVFRLWQLVRIEESLANRLRAAEGLTPRAVAQTLVECVQIFLNAARPLSQAACRLPLTLATIGASGNGAPFVGLMPSPAFLRTPEPFASGQAEELLERELSPYLAMLSARRGDILAQLGAFPDGQDGRAAGLVRGLWEAS